MLELFGLDAAFRLGGGGGGADAADEVEGSALRLRALVGGGGEVGSDFGVLEGEESSEVDGEGSFCEAGGGGGGGLDRRRMGREGTAKSFTFDDGTSDVAVDFGGAGTGD